MSAFTTNVNTKIDDTLIERNKDFLTHFANKQNDMLPFLNNNHKLVNSSDIDNDNDNDKKWHRFVISGNGHCLYNAVNIILSMNKESLSDTVNKGDNDNVNDHNFTINQKDEDGIKQDTVWLQTRFLEFLKENEYIKNLTNLQALKQGLQYAINGNGADSDGWGEIDFLYGIAKMFGICFFVWNKVSQDWSFYNATHGTDSTSGIDTDANCPCVGFIHYGGTHFDVLIPPKMENVEQNKNNPPKYSSNMSGLNTIDSTITNVEDAKKKKKEMIDILEDIQKRLNLFVDNNITELIQKNNDSSSINITLDPGKSYTLDGTSVTTKEDIKKFYQKAHDAFTAEKINDTFRGDFAKLQNYIDVINKNIEETPPSRSPSRSPSPSSSRGTSSTSTTEADLQQKITELKKQIETLKASLSSSSSSSSSSSDLKTTTKEIRPVFDDYKTGLRSMTETYEARQEYPKHISGVLYSTDDNVKREPQMMKTTQGGSRKKRLVEFDSQKRKSAKWRTYGKTLVKTQWGGAEMNKKSKDAVNDAVIKYNEFIEKYYKFKYSLDKGDNDLYSEINTLKRTIDSLDINERGSAPSTGTEVKGFGKSPLKTNRPYLKI